MRARWIAAWVGLAGIATAAAALRAVAQPAPPPPAPAPVLHEDVRSPGRSGAQAHRAPVSPALLGGDPSAGQNPTAIRDDGKILPEPESTTEPVSEEPIHGRGGFGADRDTQSVPDDHTGGDDALRYIEVFNPSVVPFKRMSALDAVRPDYTLVIGDASLTELPVTGAPTRGFDRFWGSMLVELQPGEDVPIPSVAPEMRVVSYEVQPRTQLAFSVDGAGNFYVRSDEAGASGVHRLVFLAEADPRYFAPVVPHGLRVADIPPGHGRPLPERVQRLGEQAYRRLGLRRDMSTEDALARLVEYFRAFEPRELQNPTGDIYWDLVTQQAGVCRHRSFAFMVTANALGIPTRFVSNEAHAWVEVWLPERGGARAGGWMRVDLGGAAASLEVKNAAGKSMYRPRGEDPFPKPPEYAENYTRLEGDISGLSAGQIAEAQTPRAGGPRSSAGGPDGAEPAAGAGDAAGRAGAAGEGGESGEAGAAAAGEGDGAGEPLPGPAEGLPAADPAALRGKRPTSIRVTGASPTAFRGETITVEGLVADEEGRGLSDLHVVIYLAPARHAGEGAHVVGHAVSGADGRFRAELLVPFELELREHEVFASTPGNEKLQPSVSQ
ncbi:MAG TPA: transglutaminase-like domain-containing protein [Kofleriaceae bacterium]|nr:transglutaminase-like domain-containing protein [Kofleriaceae bacterium]